MDPPSETANQATSGGFLSSILQNPISSNFDPGSNTLDLQLQSSTAVGVEPSQSCNLPFEPSQPAPMGLIGTSVSPAFGQTASIGSQTEPGTQVKRSVPVARAVEVRFFPPTTDIKAHPNLFSSKLDSPSAFEAWSNPMLRLPGSSSCDLQGNILSHFDSSRMQNGSTGCHRSFGNGLDSQEKPAAYNLEPKPAVTSDRATSGTFAGLQDICSDFHKPFTSEHAASLNISSQAQQDVQVTRCQSGGARGLGPSLSRNDLKASPESSRKHRSEKLLNDVADPEADECPGEEVSSPLHSPPSAKQWQTPPQVLRKLRQSAKLLDEEPACVRLIGSLGRDGESEPNSSVPLDRGKKGVEHGQAESRAVASGSRKTGGVKSTLVDRPARSRGSLATSCSGMPGLERLDWLASVATECRSPSEPANQDAKKVRNVVAVFFKCSGHSIGKRGFCFYIASPWYHIRHRVRKSAEVRNGCSVEARKLAVWSCASPAFDDRASDWDPSFALLYAS